MNENTLPHLKCKTFVTDSESLLPLELYAKNTDICGILDAKFISILV